MPYPVLHPAIRPSSESYSAVFPTTYLTAPTRGGMPRRRKDFDGGVHQVSVSWSLDPASYDYLMGFYRSGIQKGVLPFTMPLIIEDSTLRPYVCMLIENTFGLTGQQGLRYNVSAQLYALELNDQEVIDYQNSLVVLFNQYGADTPAFIDLLEDLVENKMRALGLF